MLAFHGNTAVLASSTAGNRPHNQQGLGPAGDGIGQQGIRGFVRQILGAGEKSQERPAQARDMVANRPFEDRITSLEGVEDRTHRDRVRDLELHFIDNGSWQRLDLDRNDRGQVADNGRPAIARIGRRIHLPAGRAEIHAT
jgi:hypothetical protein